MVKTRVNAPERVFLNSSDDPRTTSDIGFNVFTCTYDTPILGAKKTMMLRASIPNVQIQIPNYSLVFWYYKLPTATTPPEDQYLQCVRLYPSDYQPPTGFTAYTVNRYFTDPGDLVSELNIAAATGGDDATYNAYWEADDVTFFYDTVTKQISFQGNTVGEFYCPAGWNDPNVNTVVAANPSIGYIEMPTFADINNTIPQPLLANYTLNLRLGFAMSGFAFGSAVNKSSKPNPLYADLTNTAYPDTTEIPADSFPNLVYSQCIYLYSNIVAGVSLGSNKTHNLLAVVPVNTAPLGVVQYTALTVNMMSKIVDTIYEITVDMRDDAGMAFTLPDSAQVNLELAFSYD